MRSNRILFSVLTTALLSACGGGGGGSFIPVTTSFSGKVIDGYIKNAKVCLDLNSNLKCDDGPGEEEALYTKITGDGGSYSFTYTGTRDIAALHIIAEATANSIDEDDGGKTFAELGRSSVSLLTPANAPQTVSPLTTLVSNQQIVAKEEGKTLTVAEAEARAKLQSNISASVALTNNDYKDSAKGDKDTAVIAKAVTLALADSQTAIKNNTDFSAASDKSGKSSATEAIKQSIASVQTELAKNISSDGKLAVTAAQFQTNTAQTISGNIQDIVKVVAAPKTSIWDPATYLKKGMYFLSLDNGAWFGDGKTPESAVRVAGPLPVLGGVKQSSDGKKFYDSEVDWAVRTTGGAYVKKYKWAPDFYLTNNGWVKVTNDNVADVTRNENCFTMSKEYGSQEVCGKSKSWAGKTVNEAGFCTTATNNTFFKACENPDLKFPDDAISNDFSITSLSDEYRVWNVDNGPNVIYTYKQVGTLITITGPNDGLDKNYDVMLDFKTGAGIDGAYIVTSKIDSNTFTVTAETANNTEGTVVRYWGGWFNAFLNNKQEVTLENFIKNQMGYVGSYFWQENCNVAGQFIVDTSAPAGYGVSWSKGKENKDGSCGIDTSDSAKKYLQITKLSIDTVKGQKILKTTAPDVYKLAKDEYTGIDIIWAVVTNSAGVKGVYNGELTKSSVKKEIISGTKQALGNRAFVETVNKAWGYTELPADAVFFNAP